jgi:hypothetical protein
MLIYYRISFVIYLLHFLVWLCKLCSRTRVGAKIHYLWINHIQQPWASWCSTPITWHRDAAGMVPLNPSNLGEAPAYQEPPSFKTVVYSQAQALSNLTPASDVPWLAPSHRGVWGWSIPYPWIYRCARMASGHCPLECLTLTSPAILLLL